MDGQSDLSQHPVLIGEVLFDCFPDGRSVLGGAPFNVAWNLRGLGLNPLFVSAVGNDETGDEVRRRMNSWSMETGALQVRDDAPTGQVRVVFSDGQPTYEIVPEQAYDLTDSDQLGDRILNKIQQAALFYHGSLAWRSPATRRTIRKLRQDVAAPVFIDLNIRRPWFDASQLDEILDGVTWLKLNVDELSQLTGIDLPEKSSSESIAMAVDRLRMKWPCEICFVTCGSRGACAVETSGRTYFEPAIPIPNLVDTVGAGDAFAAMTIYCLLADLPIDQALKHSVRYAARVCQIQGATTDDPDFYRAFGSLLDEAAVQRIQTSDERINED